MKNTYIGSAVIGALLIGGGSFYGGMAYQKNQPVATPRAPGIQGLAGGAGGRAAGFRPGTQGRGVGMGFMAGEVVSKDTSSLTLKLTDGGSKIIFFSTSTQIGKMAQGSADDLSQGTTVTVNGTTNSDGSVMANMIQIRPSNGGMGANRNAGLNSTNTQQ